MGPKKVAVIGAGASGLAAIKCCLEEGLEPVCFEKSDDIGGVWNFRETVGNNEACVMRSTVINTSKEMMCFSDFPIPKEFANFMHHTYVQRYFRRYADNFHLLQYIQFKSKVLEIKKADDFASSGAWIIKVLNSKNEIVSDVYDAVMVCSGHHAQPYRPNIDDLEHFKGKVMHSHDYRESGQSFAGKNVLVIGVGNSALDLSVEISRVTKQTYLSTRRGAWIMHRVFHKGWPVDMIGNTRFAKFMEMEVLPQCIYNGLPEFLCNLRFDHELYGLKPQHRFSAQHPTINDDVPNRIICGAIKVKPNVKSMTDSSVIFDDGTMENIDVIILATGYTFGFSFLDESVLKVKDNKIELYKNCFLPDLEHQTLAFIGVIQPTGAIMPISELQCRLATRVFKGLASLPSMDVMQQDIKKKETERTSRYVESRRHTIQVDYILICDELAELIGCKPRIGYYIRKDPKFALKLFFGPCAPYQWRLIGPGKWEGARASLESIWERVEFPLRTRKVDDKKSNTPLFGPYYLLLAIVIILAVIFMS